MTETGEIAAWLRKQAETDIEAALKATPGPWEFEGDDPIDDELYSARDENLLPTVAWTRDRNVANGRHMERHDPLTEAERAESVLAVLDAYERTAAIASPAECPQGEAASRDYLDALRELAALDHVVRLLAAGYRSREGYMPEWA